MRRWPRGTPSSLRREPRRAETSANLEAGEPLRPLLAHVDAVDLGSPRPLAHEADEALDVVLPALEQRLDAAVAVVAHPAGDPVSVCQPADAVPEKDALHVAVDDHSPAHGPRVGQVDSLVVSLASARIGRTFNQYAASPHLRERLLAYLERHRASPILLVGEAAGYRGARVSGIPFTSERQLTGTGPAEASATIVHGVLRELGLAEDVLLWNVVPTHPGTATSNRRPTPVEIRDGLPFLAPLARGRRVLAVGRLAEQATGAPYVRHPAHGGATRFRAGLLESLR